MRVMENRIFSKGLVILFLIEFCVRFSYWGTMSIIVLYLTRYLNFSSDQAYSIFGAFAAFGFIGSLIGGWFADKVSGFRTVVLVAVLVLISGNLLVFFFPKIILLGLSLICAGSGMFTPTSANLLGEFFKTKSKSDRSFTIFYIATNCGGLLGPIIYGLFFKANVINYAFLVSSLIGLIWYVVYFVNIDCFIDKGCAPNINISPQLRYLLTIIIISFSAALIYTNRH